MTLVFGTGQLAWGSVSVPTPYTPLVFSNVTATVLGTASARIEWDVAPGAQGQVEYGATGSYGAVTALETTYLTHHSQTLTGLAPGSPYHYAPRGISVDGVPLTDPVDHTFTTDAAPALGGTPPTVSTLTNVTPPVSAPTLPAIGVAVADRMGFATTRTRIHGYAGAANHYTPQHPWNGAVDIADSRLCMTQFLTGQNSSVTLNGEPPWNLIRTGFVGNFWLERGSMYRVNYGNNSNSWTMRHVDTGATSTLKTFPGYEQVMIDDHVPGPSWDGRYWPGTFRVSAGVFRVTTWDRTGDVLGTLIPVGTSAQGGGAEGDRISVSPSGQFLSIVTENPGTGGQDFHVFGGPAHPTPSQRFAPMPYGISGYRWSSGRINPGSASGQHWDWSKDTSGDDCVVIVNDHGNTSAGPIMVRAADGWKTYLLGGSTNAFGTTGHVSGAARDMNGANSGGWAVFSEGSTASGLRTRPGYGQVVAMKLIPAATNGGTVASPQMKVYGYTEMGYGDGLWPGDNPPDEPHYPFAAPSFDGTRVLISTALRQGAPGNPYSYILAAA